MKSSATNISEYFESLPESRKKPMKDLRKTILKNLPKGFEETLNYGMPGYVVPHSIYPNGYHVKPELPLPFINFASQKNHIAFYHLGIYANPELLKWFKREYSKHCTSKLDMGKSCIRFKDPDKIPFTLIGELCSKMSVKDWIKLYETTVR